MPPYLYSNLHLFFAQRCVQRQRNLFPNITRSVVESLMLTSLGEVTDLAIQPSPLDPDEEVFQLGLNFRCNTYVTSN